MKKNTIKLNENSLRNIIKESVKRILSENFAQACPIKQKLYDMLDEGIIDPKTFAEELLGWISEDEAYEFANKEGWLDDEYEEEDSDEY